MTTPVLTLEEMRTLKNSDLTDKSGTTVFSTAVIDCTFEVDSGAEGLKAALDRISNEAR